MFYDLHCHLTRPEFSRSFKELVSECAEKRVSAVMNGLGYKDNAASLELAGGHKNLFVSFGMHPSYPFDEKVLGQIRASASSIIAVGEIGLDFKNGRDAGQISGFKRLLSLAEELEKPVIVHSREAEKEVLALIKGMKVPVILHSFFARKRVVAEACSMPNVFFSIPATVSYDEQMKALARAAPIERIFCETDSPYLWKYGVNTPLNVVKSYESISSLKNLSLAETEQIIEKSFKTVFLKR